MPLRQTLNLEGLNSDQIQNAIADPRNASAIAIENNKYEPFDLPSLHQYKHLEKIDIKSVKGTQKIRNLPLLHTLILDQSELQDGTEIDNFETSFKNIAKNIRTMPNLRHIKWSALDQISHKIPSTIAQLSQLESLDIGENFQGNIKSLTSLPLTSLTMRFYGKETQIDKRLCHFSPNTNITFIASYQDDMPKVVVPSCFQCTQWEKKGSEDSKILNCRVKPQKTATISVPSISSPLSASFSANGNAAFSISQRSTNTAQEITGNCKDFQQLLAYHKSMVTVLKDAVQKTCD